MLKGQHTCINLCNMYHGLRDAVFHRWPLFQWQADYFPVELIKTEELHPSKNYILGCHPHGIMCHSHFVNFATEGTGFSHMFPGIRSFICVLRTQFMYPLFREYFMCVGK